MKMVPNLLIAVGLLLLVVAGVSKFFNTVVLFPGVKLTSHLVVANTCLLLAIIMKLENK